MRIDAREIYLKRILTLDRSTIQSFRQFYHLSLLFLQDPDSEKDSKEIIIIQLAMFDFLRKFRSEKGTPGLESILYEMDALRLNGKKYLKVKTRYTRKKFTYPEIMFLLQELEDMIMVMVRKKAKNIRIMNPEIQI